MLIRLIKLRGEKLPVLSWPENVTQGSLAPMLCLRGFQKRAIMKRWKVCFFLLLFLIENAVGDSDPPYTTNPDCYLCRFKGSSMSEVPYNITASPDHSKLYTLTAGLFLLSRAGTLYDLEKVHPGIEIAAEKCNARILPNVGAKLNVFAATYGNACVADGVTGRAVVLSQRGDLISLIGPSCSTALDHAARLTAYLNITTVTGGGEDAMFMDKTHFPTLVRFGYGYGYILTAMANFMGSFGLAHVSLFYDATDLYARSLGSAFETALKGDAMTGGLKFNLTLTGVFVLDAVKDPDFKGALMDANERSRIFIVSANGDVLRQFMLSASELGYTNGDHAYFDVELFPAYVFGDKSWQRHDANDTKAQNAYRSLIRVSFSKRARGANYDEFDRDVRNRSSRYYGDNVFRPNETVSFLIGAFHDATIVLCEVIRLAIAAGEDLTDGLTIMHYFKSRWWNSTDLVTGPFYINDANDRLNDYNFNDMNSETGEFEPFAYYDSMQNRINYYDGHSRESIDWSSNDMQSEPPPDVPMCGYRHEYEICKPPPDRSVMYALISVFSVLVVAGVIGMLGYRHWQQKQMLNALHWLIRWDELKAIVTGENGRSSVGQSLHSIKSRQTGAKSASSSVSKRSYFTPMVEAATYQGVVVAIKRKQLMTKSNEKVLLVEMSRLKNLQHENLVRFVGACVDAPNQCFVVEYCPRGSIEDLIEATTLTWDDQFKLSILHDAAQGLLYLHKSQFAVHGNLRSTNCLVDSRFVVKLSDWHTPHFERAEQELENKANEKLLYKAPEVLRDIEIRSQPADIYSYGMIAVEILTLNPIFSEERQGLEIKDIVDRIRMKKAHGRPYRPNVVYEIMPLLLRQMVETCIEEEAEVRPNAASIINQLKKANHGKRFNVMENLFARMEQYNANLEEMVQKRNEQLLDEQKKMEHLLHELLPKPIATQLISGGHVMPEWFESVTIYFSDIVGFTTLSSDSTPMEVVQFLNDLYTCFDDTISQYDVYKVETIGDAYMLVSGLPKRNGIEHARQIARTALQLRTSVAKFKIHHRPGTQLLLRIGVHSGSCVAGVVGLKMPRYCLFGDTVNTSSRMESTSEALKIQTSSVTKLLLDELSGAFVFEARGEIEVKGKGVMKTYWLLSERQPVTPDADRPDVVPLERYI